MFFLEVIRWVGNREEPMNDSSHPLPTQKARVAAGAAGNSGFGASATSAAAAATGISTEDYGFNGREVQASGLRSQII
jgi:hypothetical protein